METMTFLGLAGLALGAYLLGAVPFGLIVAKAMGLGDPREIGSGNIGATNVLRTGSKTAGGLTLLLDALKGLAAVVAGRMLFGDGGAMLGGLAAFLGHLYPVWLRFRGGKGVATFFGVLFGLAWPLGLAAGATWVATARLSGMSSAGALAASGLAPLLGLVLGPPGVFPLLVLLAVLIWLRHHANIRRIIAGREPKIGDGRKDGTQ
ncbi:MAG: glycerol-3-phosphate 1-O-acyltransferase PlsY [Paracoccaceae bacterium]|nr:glycerol-3-phosphate 1-O-acyltransferase PlsY [Paracoccaceae bacterium]